MSNDMGEENGGKIELHGFILKIGCIALTPSRLFFRTYAGCAGGCVGHEGVALTPPKSNERTAAVLVSMVRGSGLTRCWL